MASTSPATTVYDKLWKLLRAHDELMALFRDGNIFDQREHREWRLSSEPNPADLPDLMVDVVSGGDVGNLDTNRFWFPSTQYNITSRMKDLNPVPMLDIWWQICAAVVGTTTPKLGLSFVHQSELLEPIFEFLPAEDTPQRRVIIQPLLVQWESLPPTS